MKMKKERSKVYVIKQKLEFGDSKNFIKTIHEKQQINNKIIAKIQK